MPYSDKASRNLNMYDIDTYGKPRKRHISLRALNPSSDKNGRELSTLAGGGKHVDDSWEISGLER